MIRKSVIKGMAKARTVKVNNVDVRLYKKRVQIIDSHDDVCVEEAGKIVKYLFDEGFLEVEQVDVEIITE